MFVNHNVLNRRSFRVEVDVLGSPSLSAYCLCGGKATLENGAQELCESRGGSPGIPVPNNLYSLCGRELQLSERRGCVNYDVIMAGKGLTWLMGDGPS